ncbi:hypothetical protein CH063_15761 [Colletotrichum higginsianum]|uniref:Uncharacterized protein n=1 Tax=Colletotrichum higginsianum (strain IMI 349063) TaxID=759273 RepID=H1W4B5_COLHI|nr:hypothetical protein CH063_15761 [Colletotrichum higginsianum]
MERRIQSGSSWPMLLLQPPASSLRARQTGYKEGHGARQGNLLSWQTPEQRNDEVPLFLFFPLFFWRHSLSLSQELLEDAHAPSLLRLCRQDDARATRGGGQENDGGAMGIGWVGNASLHPCGESAPSSLDR